MSRQHISIFILENNHLMLQITQAIEPNLIPNISKNYFYSPKPYPYKKIKPHYSSKLDTQIRASPQSYLLYCLLGFLKKIKYLGASVFGILGFMDHGFRATANPIFALFSMALVSTSPEMVTRDLGRHSCCIRALALP